MENCGSLSSKYTELYVNSIVGELTLETTDYEVTDHTKELENSGECKTTVDLQKQIDLGKYFNPCAVRPKSPVRGNSRRYR